MSTTHISLPLLNGLMTRPRFEPNFLRMNLCCEVRLGQHLGEDWDKVLDMFEEQC